MKTRLVALACIGVCLAAPLVAAAANEDGTQPLVIAPDKDKNIWVNVGGFSSHFNRDKGYNENNLGFGIEYRMNPEVSLMAGGYYNSVRQNTSYLAVNYQPWAMGEWKLGAAVGFMDGYPALERGGVFFAALPMASYEGKQFGVNLGVIPSIPKVDGAIVIQFKFRL
jgi:hypothetical protein